MSSDMVKTQKDSYARTRYQCQDTLASSEQEQHRVRWDVASWLLNIKDLLDTTLRMIMKYSRVKVYFDWYADFESSLSLGIWLNREDLNSLAESKYVCACKYSLLTDMALGLLVRQVHHKYFSPDHRCLYSSHMKFAFWVSRGID